MTESSGRFEDDAQAREGAPAADGTPGTGEATVVPLWRAPQAPPTVRVLAAGEAPSEGAERRRLQRGIPPQAPHFERGLRMPIPSSDGPEEAKLGRALQRARRRKRLSIDAVAETLRIRERFVRAMEAGAFSALPEPPYGTAFVREYASLVGCDPEPLLAAYSRTRPGSPFSLESLPHALDRGARRGPSRRQWMAASLGGIVLLAVLAVVFAASPGPRLEQQPSFISAPVAPASPGRATAPPPAAAPLPDRVRVDLTLSGESWIKVTVDGRTVLEDTLGAGARQRFEGREVSLVVGNAGAVRLAVDGYDLGVMGREGEVWRGSFHGGEAPPTALPSPSP